jgi:hypothetical protein
MLWTIKFSFSIAPRESSKGRVSLCSEECDFCARLQGIKGVEWRKTRSLFPDSAEFACSL